MIITDLDLQIEDVEWYGVDKNGRIAQFMSGGSFAVPEFVRESRENLEIVSHFFEKYSQIISATVLFNKNIEYPRKEFWEECKYVSQKGIYCYDICDKSELMNEYVYVCKPSCALVITDLPQDIQSVLSYYRMVKADFAKDEIIIIN